MRIVVADDMPIQVREIAESIQSKWPKWEILTAADGCEIVQQVKAKHVDIILSDIRMPQMDGLEMLSIVRRISPKTKIVFITAYPLFEYAQKALKLGATDLLLKPVDMAQLHDVLTQLSRENGEGDDIREAVQQWLMHDWDALLPEMQNFIRNRFSCGCICAIAAPKREGFPLPQHLAEDITRASGCRIYAADLANVDAHLYAMICMEDEWRCSQFFQSLQTPAMRYGFRAGVTIWSDALPENGRKLWLCALHGTEQAFYRSVGIVRSETPYSFRATEFPYGQKLLSWFTASDGWKSSMQKVIANIEKTTPDVAELLRSTRYALKDCSNLMAHSDEADSMPIIGNEMKLVIFFEEYRICLETALTQLEERYRKSLDRADPIEATMDYVRKHYMEPIALSDMAAMTRLSPNYFSTLFRKRTSMRFMEYVLQVRLEKAGDMLVNTDMFIYQIANACGYEDERYFMRVFQKAYGMSPANFRRCFGKKSEK